MPVYTIVRITKTGIKHRLRPFTGKGFIGFATKTEAKYARKFIRKTIKFKKGSRLKIIKVIKVKKKR